MKYCKNEIHVDLSWVGFTKSLKCESTEKIMMQNYLKKKKRSLECKSQIPPNERKMKEVKTTKMQFLLEEKQRRGLDF